MIRGMTGFGRAQGQGAWGAWVWEARSVNGKSVDLRTNFPPGCEAVDFEARRRVKDRFARGSFQLQLRIDSFADISQKRDYVGRLPVGLGNPTDQPGY